MPKVFPRMPRGGVGAYSSLADFDFEDASAVDDKISGQFGGEKGSEDGGDVLSGGIGQERNAAGGKVWHRFPIDGEPFFGRYGHHHVEAVAGDRHAFLQNALNVLGIEGSELMWKRGLHLSHVI